MKPGLPPVKQGTIMRKSLVADPGFGTFSASPMKRAESGQEVVRYGKVASSPGSAKRGSFVVEIEERSKRRSVAKLPQGMEYALKSCNERRYEKVIGHSIAADERVLLSIDEIRLLFEAKCKDQVVQPLPHAVKEKEARFVALVTQSCRSMHFVLREASLGPVSASCIAKILSKKLDFSRLDLSANNLKDDGVSSIASLLSTNAEIVSISLQSVGMTLKGLESLTMYLRSNQTLTELDVSMGVTQARNHLGPTGGMYFKEILSAPTSVLAVLNVSSTGLSDQGIASLSQALPTSRSLTHLDVSDNSITAFGCDSLTSAIPQSSLTHVILDRNKIGWKGLNSVFNIAGGLEYLSVGFNSTLVGHKIGKDKKMQKLNAAISEGSRLIQLKLDGNDFSNSVVESIPETLKDNKILQILTLDKCCLTKDDAVMFSSGISHPCSVTKLSLAFNDVQDEGAISLFNSLNNNIALRILDLQENHLTGGIASALIDLFSSNSTLTNLSLKQNVIKPWKSIAEGLRKNTRIVKLDIDGNPISLVDLNAVKVVLVRNGNEASKVVVPRLREKITVLRQDEEDLYETRNEITIEHGRIIKDEKHLSERKSGLDDNLTTIISEFTTIESQCAQLQSTLVAATCDSKVTASSCQLIYEQSDAKLAQATATLTPQINSEIDKQQRLQKALDALAEQMQQQQQQQVHQSPSDGSSEMLQELMEENEKLEEEIAVYLKNDPRSE